MNINRTNYEIYFIDHFDGTLDQKSERELMSFLNENPDLKEEFESFESIEVPISIISYPGKEHLKKTAVLPTLSINEDNYNDFFIAKVEEDLNPVQVAEIETFLELNPQLRHEFDLFAKTRLKPDLSIIYSGKANLRKRIVFLYSRNIIQWSAAAALLVLFVSGWFLLNQKSSNPIKDSKPLVNLEKQASSDQIVEITNPTDQFKNPDQSSVKNSPSDNHITQPDASNPEEAANSGNQSSRRNEPESIGTLFSLPVRSIPGKQDQTESMALDYKTLKVIPQYIEIEDYAYLDDNSKDGSKRQSMINKLFSRLVKKSAEFIIENKNADLLGELASIDKPDINNITFQTAVRSDDSKLTYLSFGNSFYLLKSKSSQ